MDRRQAGERLSIAVLFAIVAGAAGAALQEGVDALRRGDHPAAAAELRPLADKGNAEAHYRVSLMYEHGAG